MPPHSASMSVSDGMRGPLGDLGGGGAGTKAESRSSVPMSIASLDSLVAEPNLSPGLSSYTARLSPGGVPLRPPRLGLDLQLPDPWAAAATVASPSEVDVEVLRPASGFPWSAGTPSDRPELVSAFSSSSHTTSATPGRLLSPHSRMPDRPASTFSTLSATTTRSGNSTLSYILDPPQIITPGGKQGLKRVEVIGSRQAGLVTLAGSSNNSQATTPTFTTTPNVDPFADPLTPPLTTSTRFSSSAVGGQPLSPFDRPLSDVTDMSRRSGATESSFISNRWTGSSDARASGATRIESEGMDYLMNLDSPGSPGRITSNHALPSDAVLVDMEDEEGGRASPLPSPFLPFAGQRPTPSLHPLAASLSSNSLHSHYAYQPDRIISTDMSSIRSGFGDLENIPFQLGFPGEMQWDQ